MAFELRQLRAFVAVAELLSFAQASRRLNIAQPALSRTIRAVEDMVGSPLMTRTTRRVQLTKAGEIFLHEARRTLRQADKTIQLARNAAEGSDSQLDIGYGDFAINGPLMTALDILKEEHPGLQVCLKRHRSEEQSILVDRQLLHLGVTMQHAFNPALDVIPLTRSPLRVLLCEDHPLAAMETIPLRLLAEEDFVLGEPAIWRLYLRIINDFCSRERFLPRVVCEAFERETIFRFVAKGYGVTIYPGIIDGAHLPGIAIRPFEEEPPSLTTYAVVRRDTQNRLLARLVEIIKQNAIEDG